MEALLLLFSLLFSMGTLALIVLAMVVPLGLMIGLPFWYRETWAAWTASGRVLDAWDNVAGGATRGPLQVFPASYLFEQVVRVEASPENARAGLEKHYGSQPFVKVLASDEDGLAVDLRIPNGLGPGWVGVYRVQSDGDGARIDVRLRSTFCLPFPVLTFFLSLQHRLHHERILRQAIAKA